METLELLSIEIQKLINKVFLKKKDLIEKAFNDGADWIAFNIENNATAIIIKSQAFKGTMNNTIKWSEIYDLKLYKERLKSMRITDIKLEQ